MAHGFGDVALFGLGASTRAAAEYLSALPAGEVGSLTMYAGPSTPSSRAASEELEALGVRVVWDVEEPERDFDLGVVSPGIPAIGTFYAAASRRCAEVVSEPELAWRESPRDWVAITGTNGKTTTTTLACELLRSSGLRARTVGNIGLPPIACVADRCDGEVFVAELSSFQLHSMRRFAPRAAVVLNVTPDHVEWHGTLGAYAADKERVFANMGPGDLCVLGADETCRAMAGRLLLAGRRVAVLGEEPRCCAADGAWLNGEGRLVVRLNGRDHVLCRFDDMRIKGPHNAQNALAAAALALEAGASDEGVVKGLLAFSPLEHRIEPCGSFEGVGFYDDSKATNVDAAEKALAAFEPGKVVVMLGGHDKGTDLADFARSVVSRCRGAVAYGAAGERFYEALARARAEAGDSCPCRVERCPDMRAAFDAARALARPGDVVLLSPACSSFDEFSGYAERGRTFKGWVAELGSAGEGGAR